MKAELRGPPSPISLPSPSLFTTAQSSITGAALNGCLGSLDGACIEKLLLHCAAALESNDATLAQQVMWVLNNVASSTGDPNQRITSYFLRALVARSARLFPAATATATAGVIPTSPAKAMTVTELAGYVDLIPWHRFGYCASNGAICRAALGKSRVHILDFTTTHCMQWPTLIDSMAKMAGGPPSLRITVPSIRPPVPPFLAAPIREVGLRLANFAKSREVPFHFHVIPSLANNDDDDSNISTESNDDLLLAQLDPSRLDLRDDELLIVNCQSWLRYLSDELSGTSTSALPSTRDAFLSIVHSLNPGLVLVTDEDVDLDCCTTLTSRIASCFNYVWIPFDALETFLPRESEQRMGYEADVGHKIENVVGFERRRRIERPETALKTAQRMRRAGFGSLPFCEETVREVKVLLDEHASGWGMKREEDHNLVLTWKGNNAVFAAAWVPTTFHG